MRLPYGDRVREPDGHYVGRVEAIHHGAFVKVKWEDTGWISEYRRSRRAVASAPSEEAAAVDRVRLEIEIEERRVR
jgi:hypothetical protein